MTQPDLKREEAAEIAALEQRARALLDRRSFARVVGAAALAAPVLSTVVVPSKALAQGMSSQSQGHGGMGNMDNMGG